MKKQTTSLKNLKPVESVKLSKPKANTKPVDKAQVLSPNVGALQAGKTTKKIPLDINYNLAPIKVVKQRVVKPKRMVLEDFQQSGDAYKYGAMCPVKKPESLDSTGKIALSSGAEQYESMPKTGLGYSPWGPSGELKKSLAGIKK